jgi:hypothetical protein
LSPTDEQSLILTGDCKQERTGSTAANGKVHFAEAQGGLSGFLAVNAEVVAAAAVDFGKFSGLLEHSAEAAAGVKDAAFIGLDHFDEELDEWIGERGMMFDR